MKRASATDLQYEVTVTPRESAQTDIQYATVFTFLVYSHDKATTVTYPRMATPSTIDKMRGKVNEETAWVVDVASLDVEGFYLGPDRNG